MSAVRFRYGALNKTKTMTTTVEQKVSETLLQESRTISIGSRKFEVKSPTLATLVKVSGLISSIPSHSADGQTPIDIISQSLSAAKDLSVIADIMAIMICGVKKTPSIMHSMRIARTRSYILHNMSPSEINVKLVELLTMLEVSLFFSTITFLNGVNLIKKRT